MITSSAYLTFRKLENIPRSPYSGSSTYDRQDTWNLPHYLWRPRQEHLDGYESPAIRIKSWGFKGNVGSSGSTPVYVTPKSVYTP